MEKVAAALSHPVRSALLNLLGMRPGSGATELARWSGQPVGSVRKQLKILVDDGLIRVDHQERRRGVAKRYYANAMEIFLEDADEELNERTMVLATLGILRLIFDGATRAVSGGTLTAREDRVVANTPGEVDEQGWKRLAELHAELVERIQEVLAESRARLEASGEDPSVNFTSGVILVESPLLEEEDDADK